MLSVMWIPGLLFLLLMSSCLPVLSDPPDTPMETSDDQGHTEQGHESGGREGKCEKITNWFKNNYRGVGDVLVANIEPVPIVGGQIAGGIKSMLLLAPQADPMNVVYSDIKALDVKLDYFRAEIKWAAGVYQIPVNNIEKAWYKYTELVSGYSKTTRSEKEALI